MIQTFSMIREKEKSIYSYDMSHLSDDIQEKYLWNQSYPCMSPFNILYTAHAFLQDNGINYLTIIFL